jgi:hypothetical protein
LLLESWLWPGPLLSPSVPSIWTLAASKDSRCACGDSRRVMTLRSVRLKFFGVDESGNATF